MTRNESHLNLTSVSPETTRITPLAEYISQATKKDVEEQLSLLEEIAACRGMLQVYRPVVDRSINRFNELIKKDPNDKNAAKILAALTAIGSQMLEATSKFSRVVKAGAEIELIRATRLDAVQLMHILSQIPDLIAASAIERIETVIQDLNGIKVDIPQQIRVNTPTTCDITGIALSEVTKGTVLIRIYPQGRVTVRDGISFIKRVPYLVLSSDTSGRYNFLFLLHKTDGSLSIVEREFEVVE